jgi:DNA polymerase I-like protein with 3'-5' exonuclease and polymerase domains
MVAILTLDFETYDPYIDRGMGAGWVYGLNVPTSDFKVLGAALKKGNDTSIYTSNVNTIREHVDEADILIMHNAQYDLGCLKFLGIDYKTKKVFDTDTMSRLYNSAAPSHSLDALSKKYLRKSKGGLRMASAVLDADIYPLTKKDRKDGTRPAEEKVLKWVMKNMDVVQTNCYAIVAEYATCDADLTKELFDFFKLHIAEDTAEYYSYFSRICIDMRAQGVRINLDTCRDILAEMRPKIADLFADVYRIAGEEFNLKSIKETPAVFDKLGIAYPKTAKGNPSITTPWMEKQEHPLCKAIIKARKYKNIVDNFIEKLLLMQEYTLGIPQEQIDEQSNGVLYPELNLMRARTGRFSCSSPNIQQIPTRDEELGPLCRSIFEPNPDEVWYSLDFSNQEGRIQIHYANLLGCSGASTIAQEFKVNPAFDLHQYIADMADIDRFTAKTINLGLSYGMGLDKLAISLSLTKAQAQELRAKYDAFAPYLKQLSRKCKDTIRKNKSIKTLGGRRIAMEPPQYINGEKVIFDYKALNQLIQGSAADQTMAAMRQAYDADIKMLFPVHDEINISGTIEDAKRLKDIMENCIPLAVPCLTEIGQGKTWAEAH